MTKVYIIPAGHYNVKEEIVKSQCLSRVVLFFFSHFFFSRSE